MRYVVQAEDGTFLAGKGGYVWTEDLDRARVFLQERSARSSVEALWRGLKKPYTLRRVSLTLAD